MSTQIIMCAYCQKQWETIDPSRDVRLHWVKIAGKQRFVCFDGKDSCQPTCALCGGHEAASRTTDEPVDGLDFDVLVWDASISAYVHQLPYRQRDGCKVNCARCLKTGNDLGSVTTSNVSERGLQFHPGLGRFVHADRDKCRPSSD